MAHNIEIAIGGISKTTSLIDSYVVRQRCSSERAFNVLFSKVRVNHPDPFDAVEGSFPPKSGLESGGNKF